MKTTSKSGKFKGHSLGYRLYAASCQYVLDIDGEELPSWWNLSKPERAAWEAYAINEMLSVVEPNAFLESTYSVMGLND